MKGNIKAPRRKSADTRTHVGSLTLTAQDELEERFLSLLSYVIFPHSKRDAEFDRWLKKRLNVAKKPKARPQ